MIIEDCECACNALGGTLACIENPEQSDLLKSFFQPEEDYVSDWFVPADDRKPIQGVEVDCRGEPEEQFQGLGYMDARKRAR